MGLALGFLYMTAPWNWIAAKITFQSHLHQLSLPCPELLHAEPRLKKVFRTPSSFSGKGASFSRGNGPHGHRTVRVTPRQQYEVPHEYRRREVDGSGFRRVQVQ